MAQTLIMRLLTFLFKRKGSRRGIWPTPVFELWMITAHIPFDNCKDILVLVVDQCVDAVNFFNLPRLKNAEEHGEYLPRLEFSDAAVSPWSFAEEVAVKLEAVKSAEKTCPFDLGHAANFKCGVEAVEEKSDGFVQKWPGECTIEARNIKKDVLRAQLQDDIGRCRPQGNVLVNKSPDDLGLKRMIKSDEPSSYRNADF